MSLHLGNLSPRIRRDELLRVFRSFGRCTLQVKDKFGFVIYEYLANAESALGTLRGQKICGERITLSWSNRQPQPLQRHARGGITHELPRGRHFGREDHSNRNLGSYVRDDNRRSFRQVDRRSGRLDSPEPIAEATGRQFNNMEGYGGDKNHDFIQDLPDEGGGDEENLLEHDRRAVQVVGNGLENELDFDRYEPFQGDNRKEHGDKPKTDQVDRPKMEILHNSESQKSCYVCGEDGHGVRNCPEELEHHSNRSGGLFLDTKGLPTGQRKFDREASNSGNHQRLLDQRDSAEGRLTSRVRQNEYQGKKRNTRENSTPERLESKKARIPVSSSIHSDYTPSRSWSGSRSGISMDSKSSTSNPSPPRSGKFKSQPISRSSSPKSQPLSSSPSGLQQGSLANNCGLEFKETSDQAEQFVKGDTLSDTSRLDMMKVGGQNENLAALDVEEDPIDNHLLRRDDVSNYSMASDTCQTKISHVSLSDNNGHKARNPSQKSFRETGKLTNNDFIGDDKSMQIKDLDMEASGRLRAANLMNISAKELCLVLKNCGLEQPDENENGWPPEIYFGSARLWPWEVIYYRRLKKGLISKENYALRLAQNEEFGIVDKYIRRSSGWGEQTGENP